MFVLLDWLNTPLSRMGFAFFTALILTLWMGPNLIGWLKKKQGEGQPIRECGPETHLAKKGTPTMGGIMILLAATGSALLWTNLANAYVWILLGTLWGFGLVGGIDDYLKLTHNNSAKGVPGRTRLVIEFALSLLACLGMMYFGNTDTQTTLTIPFYKNILIDLSIFYIPFAMFVMVGAANSVNLTDGLDGLVSVPVIMTLIVFGIIAWSVDIPDFSHIYLQGTQELTVLCCALTGAVLGFLWYNCHPAKVFMGDTGSLALGGFIGAIAVATKHEIILAVTGAIFVAEALSVMIQVASYKLRGKRVFLMAPIHHHFEKMGWHETTVVTRFWILSVFLAVLALTILALS